jgi:hypothetical protein
VRWEDKVEQFRDKSGQETVSRSKVFLAQDVSMDGYLFLGDSSVADPRDVPGANEIRALSKIPDLRSATALRVAYL